MMEMLKRTGIAVLLAAACLQPAVLTAQSSLLEMAGKHRVDRKNTPTRVSADAMDIDIANNKATFMGNVIVDDPEMLLTCRRMIIELTDDKNAKALQADIARGKKLSRIICEEDVCITRKQEKGKLGEEQKAMAGHAVYNVRENSITLTENPVILKGASKVRGERITMYLNSERVAIVNGRVESSELKPNVGR